MTTQVMSEETSALGHASDSPADPTPSRDFVAFGSKLLLPFALLVAFATYWYPMLGRDLRFDENLTAWVISGSFVETVERSWVHQGQSPLYFMMIWAWQAVAGSSEVALRVPSMVALFVSCWQLQMLGKELDQRRVGQFAAIFLLVAETGATEARPYIFMILALIVSTRYGFRWLSSGARSAGLVWVVSAAVAIAMQPFAVYALVPHLTLAVLAVRKGRGLSLLGFVTLGALLVAPIVPQILMLRARQDTLVIAAPPTVVDFLSSLAPAHMCVGLVAALILDRRRTDMSLSGATGLGFITLWAVLPSLGLFLQSHVTGSSVFVERYYFAAIPAAALLVAMVLARAKPWVGVVGVVIVVLSATLFVNPVQSRDWYAAVEFLEQAPTDANIWTVTGYIESNNPEAFADDEDNEYLNAPIRWHGAEQDLLAIPRTDIYANRAIIDANIDALDRSGPRTVVIVESVEGPIRQSGPEYAEEALLLDGFEITERQPDLGVLVTTFVSN